MGESKSTGDHKLTVTGPSGLATKVSGRGDCQTRSLVSVCSAVSSLFFVARARCETDLSPYSIGLKKNMVRNWFYSILVWSGWIFNLCFVVLRAKSVIVFFS